MNRLKELRKEKGLTQESLAREIGTTKLTVSNWENEKHIIKSDRAQELADFFGVSVGYLLGYETESGGISKDDEISLDDIENRVMTFDGKPLDDDDKLAIKNIIEIYLGKKGGA